MNRLKKISNSIILAASLFTFVVDIYCRPVPTSQKYEDVYAQAKAESQQQADAFWAGAIGAFAGAAIGYLIGSADSHATVECQVVEKFDMYQPELLSAKASRVKYDLDSMAKYGQHFNLYDSYRTGAILEEEVIVNLYKLGFRLDQIDDSFYTKLAQEHKILSDAGYTIWWNGFKMLERQKDLYLSTSHKISAYFNRHEDFIRACQLINYYDELPSYSYDLFSWIQSSYRYRYHYPLLHFVNKIEADMQKLARFITRYSGEYVVMRARATQRLLQHVYSILYNSYAYRQEVQEKQHNELLDEQRKQREAYERAEQERFAIIRKQTQALQEANQLAEQRNRIERERNH